MARTNPRVLAALAITATHVIDALTIPVEPSIRDALALVARAARGETLKAKLTPLVAAIDALAEAKRRWTSPGEKDYHWAVNAVSVIVRMAATGEDHRELAITHLGYGLAGGEDAALRVRPWYRAAIASVRTLSSAAAPRKVNAAKVAAEAAELARIAKLLGRNGALVAKTGARHHGKRAGSRATLTALLRRKRYPVHASVLAFDAAFGGLMIPDAGADDDWFETDLATHVGAFACLSLDDTSRGGRTDLVPVALTPNDGVAYLDRAGVAYYEDTIEDLAPKRFAATGAAAVVKLLRASRR